MRDLSDIKQYLKKAYSQVPTDFALTEVRNALYYALQKVEQYEIKVGRRIEVQKQNQQIEAVKALNPLQFKTTLDEINKMIAEEEKNISELTAKKGKNEPRDDVQTLHD